MKFIDEMTEPPMVGRYYLVPTVRGQFFGRLRYWPVIGPKHTDREFLDFDHQHFHLDGRFISPRTERGLLRDFLSADASYSLELLVATWPLMIDIGGVEYRRRRCWRVESVYDYPRMGGTQFETLWRAYAGQKCARDANGVLICPHRGAPISALVPHDNIVRCPLHGLRINVETGVVEAAE